MHIYKYILDARERAKARSLLDPSDPCDAKAFSPPMSDLDIWFPLISELVFPISFPGLQLSACSAFGNLWFSLPPLKSISDKRC